MKKSENSLAGRVTKRISMMLAVSMALLFIGSFLLVYRVVYTKTVSYLHSIVGVYSDLVIYQAEVPIDEQHYEIGLLYGDYICKWYNVDYAYMYVPDIENGKLTYVYASCNDSKLDEMPDDHLIGYTKDYKLSDAELKAWNGEKPYAGVIKMNEYGNEFDLVMPVTDYYGNKVMSGVSFSCAQLFGQVIKFFIIFAIMIFAVIVGIYFAVYYLIKKRISDPAEELGKSMQEFLADGKRTPIELKGGEPDEYIMIAESFNTMSKNIDSYLENINAFTRDKEHRETELDIASHIQRGFLPQDFILNSVFEIRTEMIPAKDVGGDLYDYVMLDESRVLVAIADVSGKGISAALFMAVTMMLIRQYAGMNLTPAEILEKTNDFLSRNNPAMLFATAFVGIFDSKTKEFTYANAGHNLPYVIGNEVKILDGAEGVLMGLFAGEKYSQNTVNLNIGDTVLMYTDGVTEAVNGRNEFFGDERLKNLVEEFRRTHKTDIVSYVNKAVTDYADGAERHDDITMLALTVKDTLEIFLDPEIREFERIKAAILGMPLPRSRQIELCVAAEEIFVNICSYAFEGKDAEGEKVRFTLSVSDKVEMRFEDSGQPFNPLESVEKPEDYDIDNHIGGLGKYIAFSSVDDAEYEYKDGKNIIILAKYFEEENK